MIIKNKQGDTWKELYPKTLASNVTLNDGRNLEDFKTDIEASIPSTNTLWEGTRYPDEDQVIEPNKRLSNCANGWILRWQGYVRGEGVTNRYFHYSYIPKVHGVFNPGNPIRFVLGQTNGLVVFKYVFVHDNRLIGHNTNGAGDNDKLALTGVFEW